MQIEEIELNKLEAHPLNANVMPAVLFAKLRAHLERTGRYPPVIVRSRGEGYQILDGHHRVRALGELGRTHARCVVWEVDDGEAALLLATLNRLQGRDDVRKRGALLDEVSRSLGTSLKELSAMTPEGLPDLRHLMEACAEPIRPRRPRGLEEMPVAVHFFLLPAQRAVLEARLRAMGGLREEALMRLIEKG